LVFVFGAAVAVAACSSEPVRLPGEIGCTAPSNSFCEQCSGGQEVSCTEAKPILACCVHVQKPMSDVARGLHLKRNSSANPALDLGCLADPGRFEAPRTVKVTGFVRTYKSGVDTADVKIEIFREDDGSAVGAPYSTTAGDPPKDPTPGYLDGCPADRCKLRTFTYDGVPTETPLLVRTSDARASGTWATVYEYNVFFRNAQVAPDGSVAYEPAALASSDLLTLASEAGLPLDAGTGMLAGEVLDCGGVRLSGAVVGTSAQNTRTVYFTDKESSPLPDTSRLQTSKLGMFAAFNLSPGRVRASAVGRHQGDTILLGTHDVEIFPGTLSIVNLRGRRPLPPAPVQ
jgi:hypothetical protein